MGEGQRESKPFDRSVKIWYQISQFALFRREALRCLEGKRCVVALFRKETHQYISI